MGLARIRTASFCQPPDAHQAHSRQLRNLRRQPRIRKVFNFRQGQGIRTERQGQNRCVCRIALAVDRRGGEVRRQVSSGRVNRLLHLLLRHIDIQAEVKL